MGGRGKGGVREGKGGVREGQGEEHVQEVPSEDTPLELGDIRPKDPSESITLL